MAEIIPFRGILYNPSKIDNMANVVAPPFDIISEQEQLEYHESHPNNIIRLTLGKTYENDTSTNNRYTRASDCFNKWLSENILEQDEKSAFYLTAHEFPFENKPITRYGLITLVGLEPFEKGIVLPHEKTFSKVRSQRLELIKECKANLSAIFSLYSDKKNQILNTLKDAISNKTPDLDFTDYNSHKHRLWRITDKAVRQYIAEALKEKTIFIADGHHRYETALNYREWLSTNDPNFNSSHPANYVMMHLCSMEDPGLIILPAHRMFNKVPASLRETFILFMKDCPELYLLVLKPGVMEKMFGDELPEALRNIDVTVLTRLILMELLGFDQARLDNEKLIAYSSIAEDAVDAIAAGRHDITFILNPTKIQQVRNIAEAGLIMPRKATYFFPKVITGQAINKLD